MPKKPKDLAGNRFGRLVAFRYVPGTRTPRTAGAWEVQCDCGNKKTVRTHLLTSGLTVSCGCYAKEQSRLRNKTHDMTHSPEFQSWTAMKKRCRYAGHPRWHRYGGRGIEICARWEQFELFYEDMGPRPTGTSLDRIDLEVGYEPNNCRWLPVSEQSQNRDIVKRAIKEGTSRTFNPDGSRKERLRPYQPRGKR